MVNWYRVSLIALLLGLFLTNVLSYDVIQGLNFNIAHFQKVLSEYPNDQLLIKSATTLINEDGKALLERYAIAVVSNSVLIGLIYLTITRWRKSI